MLLEPCSAKTRPHNVVHGIFPNKNMATMSMQTSALITKPASGLTRRSAPVKSRNAMVRLCRIVHEYDSLLPNTQNERVW